VREAFSWTRPSIKEFASMTKQPNDSAESRPSSAVGLIPLSTNDDDDVSFIDIASRLVSATAASNDLPIVYTVHIDNWFGRRWLGFCGKIFGIAGVRNRTLKQSLTLPPFHPHRVLGGVEYHLNSDHCYEKRGDLSTIHKLRPSQENIGNTIRSNTLFAWYSGNTVTTRKGVLMVYFTTSDTTKAWYVMFDGDAGWRLEQHVGITRREVLDLMEYHSNLSQLTDIV
jgi:hypothetical protein